MALLNPDTINRTGLSSSALPPKPTIMGVRINYDGKAVDLSNDDVELLKKAYTYKGKQDSIWSLNARSSYKTDLDKSLAQLGLPSVEYFDDVTKYAGSGGFDDVYGSVDAGAWDKMLEYWKEDWEYGISDEDRRRQLNGIAPTSYDKDYADTLLDAELKEKGLPPSKLLESKYGEKYNAWRNDSVQYNNLLADATRLVVDSDSNLATMNEAVAYLLSTDKYNGFSEHYYVDAVLPQKSDDKYARYVWADGTVHSSPEFDTNYYDSSTGDVVKQEPSFFDEQAWMKDYTSALAKQEKQKSDEFAITTEGLESFYSENAAVALATITTEEYFEERKNTNPNASEFTQKYYDIYASQQANQGKDFSLDDLFGDTSKWDEETKSLYAPYLQEANRIKREDGAEALNQYLSVTMPRQLDEVTFNEYAAEYRVSKPNATDAEIKTSMYTTQYGLTDEEIARVEGGETIHSVVASKVSTPEGVLEYAQNRVDAVFAGAGYPSSYRELESHLAFIAPLANGYTKNGWGEAMGDTSNPVNFLAEDKALYDFFLNNADIVRTMYGTGFFEGAIHSGITKESLIYAIEDGVAFEDLPDYLFAHPSNAFVADGLNQSQVEIDIYLRSWAQNYLDFCNNAKAKHDDLTIRFSAEAAQYRPDFRENSVLDGDFATVASGLLGDEKAADILNRGLTDNEKDSFAYLVNVDGDEKATDYLNAMVDIADGRLARVREGEWEEWAGTNLGTKILATIGGTLISLGEGVVSLFANTGKLIGGVKAYQSEAFTLGSSLIEGVSQTIDSDAGRFFYNLVPSAINAGGMLALAYATGGSSVAINLTSSVLASQAFNDSFNEGIESGLSQGQAYARGVASGVNEFVFERISIGSLIKTTNITAVVAREITQHGTDKAFGIITKNVLSSLLVQAGVEASEEFFTELANVMADAFIAGDKSQYNQRLQSYIDDGLSLEDAQAQAMLDTIKQLGTAALGGLVLGGFMGGVGSSINVAAGQGIDMVAERVKNTSAISADAAIKYVRRNGAVINGSITQSSAEKVFGELYRKGADSAVLQAAMNSVTTKDTSVDVFNVIERYIDSAQQRTHNAIATAYGKVARKYGMSNTEVNAEVAKYLEARNYVVNISEQSKISDALALLSHGEASRIMLQDESFKRTGVRPKVPSSRYTTQNSGLIAEGTTHLAELVKANPALAQQGTDTTLFYNAAKESGMSEDAAANFSANANALQSMIASTGFQSSLSLLLGESGAPNAAAAFRRALSGNVASGNMSIILAAIGDSAHNGLTFTDIFGGQNKAALDAAIIAMGATAQSGTLRSNVYNTMVRQGYTPALMDILTHAVVFESVSVEERTKLEKRAKTMTDVEVAETVETIDNASKVIENSKSIYQETLAANEKTKSERVAEIAGLETKRKMCDLATKDGVKNFKSITELISSKQTQLNNHLTNSETEAKTAKKTRDNAVNDAEKKIQKATSSLMNHTAGFVQAFTSELDAMSRTEMVDLERLNQKWENIQARSQTEQEAINERLIAQQKRGAYRFAEDIGVRLKIRPFDANINDELGIPENDRISESDFGFEFGGTIYINESMLDPAHDTVKQRVLLHELTHIIEQGGESYSDYVSFVENQMQKMKYSPVELQNLILRQAADNGRSMTREQARAEMVAKFTEQYMLASPSAIAEFVTQNPTGARRIFNWIANKVKSIGRSKADKQMLALKAHFKQALGEALSSYSTNVQNTPAKQVTPAAQPVVASEETVDKQAENAYNDYDDYRVIVAPYRSTTITNANESELKRQAELAQQATTESSEQTAQLGEIPARLVSVPEAESTGAVEQEATEERKLKEQAFKERTDKLNALFTQTEQKRANRHELNLTHDEIDAEYARKRRAIMSEYSSVLGVTRYSELSFDELLERYGAQRQGASPRVENRPVPNRTGDNSPVSQFARTAAEAPIFSDQMYTGVIQPMIVDEVLSYTPVSNNTLLARARKRIEGYGSLENAALRLSDDVRTNAVTADTVAFGENILAEAAHSGNTGLVERVLADLCLAAQSAGRTLQAFSLLKKMSPAGQLHFVEQTVARVNEKFESYGFMGKKSFKFEITDAEKSALLNARTPDEIKAAENTIMKRLAESMPLSLSERLNTWRYVAMLGNPKTHFRNIVGNMLMSALTNEKNIIGTALEKIDVSRGKMSTGERTKAVYLRGKHPEVSAYSNRVYEENKSALTSGSKFVENGLNQYKRYFKHNLPNSYAKLIFNSLEKADGWSLKRRFISTMNQQVVARGLDVANITVQQQSNMVNWAIQEAQRATFRDASELASLLQKASKNKYAAIAIEGIMPFKKTPINIAKRGIEYSPVGILQGLVQLKNSASAKSNYTRVQALDRIASGLTGTANMALGMFLSSLGIISIGYDDKDARRLEDATGTPKYSLNIFGVSMDISSLAPATIPIFMGVALYDVASGNEEFELSDLIGVLAQVVDPLTEMSVLSGVNQTLQDISYADSDENVGGYFGALAWSALSSYGQQFIPSSLGQVERIIDPYSRSYDSTNESNISYLGRGILNKTAAFLSPTRTNVKGEEVRNYDSVGTFFLNLANQVVFPATIKIDKKTDVDRELLRLFESVDSSDVLPRKPSSYVGEIRVLGENGPVKIYLTDSEYADFQKEYGQAVYAQVQEFIGSVVYGQYTDEQRADIISGIIQDAGKAVKSVWKAKAAKRKLG